MFLASWLLIPGCGGDGKEPAAGEGIRETNIVLVSADITSPATWTRENVYVIRGGTLVSSTLVIAPGTTVKFEANGRLFTTGNGAVVADGTEGGRIAFTSIKDDARGGDTNGDGASTKPSRGDWWGISLSGGNGSVFRHCDFAYSGGSPDGGGGSALDLGDTDRTTVADCLFEGNDGGVPGNPRGALRADSAGRSTVIARNVFHGNNVPLAIHPDVPVDRTNAFHDPADPAVTNRYNGIFVAGGELAVPMVWSCAEAPFVVQAPLRIRDVLTLSPGTIVKFAIGSWMSTGPSGRIEASGTAASRVRLTSIRDDASGGDTNGDGGATRPSRGDWGGILLFDGNGSVFRNCDLRYGGIDGGAALDIERAAGTTVDGCVFAVNDGGLDAGHAGTGTVIANNTFHGNVIPLTVNPGIDVDDSNVFHDPTRPSDRNVYNGIFLHGQDLTEPKRWTEKEVPFVIPSILQVYASLTLGPNVVLKFGARQGLRIYNRQGEGALAASAGARFTSLRDDRLLGDTNGDGAATSPQDGDWDGILFDEIDGLAMAYPAWPNVFYDSH
jgi:hypothetical protein